MNTDTHLAVGYDGKSDSIAALSWAAKLASLRGEALVAITITDPRENPRGVAWPKSYWDDVDDRARAVFAQWPDLDATIERHAGHLVPRLLECARDASMLVLGSKGHSLVGEMLRGSVSQSAARHARVPVVVYRAPADPDSGRIVVGVDGSEAGDRALEFACGMAGLTGDKVVALRAWDPAPVVPDRFGSLPSGPDTLEQAEAALGRTVEAVGSAHPDIPIQGELVHRAPERGLAEASSSASLVVVGSRGHNVAGELLLGSVSRTVLQKAHSPVAVVH